MLKMPTIDVQNSADKAGTETKVTAKDVNVYYGEKHALQNVTVNIPDRAVMAFIGPSGCGKSTFLRCINRMNDTIPIARVNGKIVIDNQDIYDRNLDVVQLRARVGMVFQKPNPFPKSIYENVAYGLRVRGERNRQLLEEKVEQNAQPDVPFPERRAINQVALRFQFDHERTIGGWARWALDQVDGWK